MDIKEEAMIEKIDSEKEDNNNVLKK